MADKVNQPAAPLAPSTDKKQTPEVTVAVSPVSMEVTSVTTVSSVDTDLTSMDKKPLSAILFVCLYALFNACLFGMDAIRTIIKNRTPCTPNQSTWFWKCVELTDAAEAEATTLVRWQLRCSVVQAAYAAVALLLMVTGRRRRSSSWAWALAFVALVATAATHCMSAMVDRILLAAAPGDAGGNVVNVVVDFAVAVLDMGFLCLLLLLADGEE
ncbi:hypothetical protein HU200_035509 [Digitaria exilis]|uniref:Uncharacterized protein n=1 Tax=Digitaria exilis TaxID=1010633 RepID=A0A835BHJ4_9POAL|nr:hypothetical protein HU200_035509 [Digitaria exilis]